MFTVFLVGICGGSGSGKSSVTRKIRETLGKDKVAYLQEDAYYKDRSNIPEEDRGNINFDHPESLDWELFETHVEQLSQDLPVDKPVYDFKDHIRVEETELVTPRRIVLIEGILIFNNPMIRNKLDLKIYMGPSSDLRLIRRLQRDIEERGRTVESVIEQYQATVRPMHFEFVEPSKRFADIIIPNIANYESGKDMIVKLLQEKMKD
jgi:uridine kinase